MLEVDKDAETVTIQPHHAQLTEKLKLSLSQVQKHFTTGDHVKVIAGLTPTLTPTPIRTPTLTLTLTLIPPVIPSR